MTPSLTPIQLGRSLAKIAIMLLAIALSACQKPVMLMPTPEVFRTGEIDVFEDTPEDERSLIIPVVYATNRLPAHDFEKYAYTTDFDNNLRVGVARIHVGDDPSKSWNDLYAISSGAERKDDIPLRLHEVDEMYVLSPGTETEHPAPAAHELVAALDDALAHSDDPDLLIFIHGANNNFYRSVAQAAQYRHFTGRRTVVLAFVWPSQEHILRYGTDVKYALQTAPMLANLVELIAMHTNVRHINLLGYSLGAQVLSNGLNTLRDNHPDESETSLKERLKIGEVYYAAGDIKFSLFVRQLKNYEGIVDRVSLTVNLNDSALRFSQIVQGASRAGRPDADELSEEETLFLTEASASPKFDIIEVESAAAPYEMYKAHDYWYQNPRVSTDILIQMLSHAPPDKRGLMPFITPRNFKVWYFPEDYNERAIAAVNAIQAESED
jgi:esterase/lipase superfamily enzyme